MDVSAVAIVYMLAKYIWYQSFLCCESLPSYQCIAMLYTVLQAVLVVMLPLLAMASLCATLPMLAMLPVLAMFL